MIFADPFPFFGEAGFVLSYLSVILNMSTYKTKEETMKRYAINYEETYSGTFTVELDDDSTEQDAINELLNNADEYRLGEQVELSDSDAQVIKTENVEG